MSTSADEQAGVGDRELRDCSGRRRTSCRLGGRLPDGEDVRGAGDQRTGQGRAEIDADGELSEQEERQLFEHYGVPYTTEGSTTAQGAAASGEAAAGDDAMTRSEEEVRVGTAPAGARPCEAAQIRGDRAGPEDRPGQREEVRVEREPITEANRDQAMSGPEISEGRARGHPARGGARWSRSGPSRRSACGSVRTPSTEEREVSEEVRKERIETRRRAPSPVIGRLPPREIRTA